MNEILEKNFLQKNKAAIAYVKLIFQRKHRNKGRSKKELGKLCNEKIEAHHIVPKSCGGTDSPYNLVFLALTEHFLAHDLLRTAVKIEYQRKMELAYEAVLHRIPKKSRSPEIKQALTVKKAPKKRKKQAQRINRRREREQKPRIGFNMGCIIYSTGTKKFIHDSNAIEFLLSKNHNVSEVVHEIKTNGVYKAHEYELTVY